MARDYTKYTVDGLGENLNKRQLVFQIVKDYVEKKKPSFDKLSSVFKDEVTLWFLVKFLTIIK